MGDGGVVGKLLAVRKGTIPGGIASRPIPKRRRYQWLFRVVYRLDLYQGGSCTRDGSRWCSASTYTREAAKPGMASNVDPCLYQSPFLFIPVTCFVHTRRSLATPMASWWGALLGSIHARRAIPASLTGRA